MRIAPIAALTLGFTALAAPLAAQPGRSGESAGVWIEEEAQPEQPRAPPDPAALMAAQRQAMAAFARMDGVWRGPAWTLTPSGRHEIIQTERIGTFLDGTIRVIEGRGYQADGRVGFNALGVISFDPASRTYTLTSWAQSYQGSYPIRPTADGYAWQIWDGAGTIRYTATFRDGVLREIGERFGDGGGPPVQVFEMNLRRIADSDWPAAGPVPGR